MICALVAYLGAFFFSFLKSGRKLGLALTVLGTGSLGMVIYSRYQEAWPMLPMFLGVLFLAFCLACLRIIFHKYTPRLHPRCYQVTLDGIVLLLVTLAVLFPKDFYLPFIRSNTWFAHLFFITGTIGKALLIIAAVRAFCGQFSKNRAIPTRESFTLVLPWMSWGYGFLTISMFSGEVWSFLGWGMPVVWHDPAIAVAMTLWFYWTGVLHLHYMGNCGPQCRAILTTIGGLLIVFLGCYPELGPWEPVRLLNLLL